MHDITMQPILSFNSLKRSSRIIKVFVQFYCPIQEIDTEEILDLLPVVNFCSAFVYELDTLTETAQDIGESYDKFDKKYEILAEILKTEKLYDVAVERELANLKIYFHEESVIMSNPKPSYGEIVSLLDLRSADVRLLHRLLFKQLARDYDETLFDILFPLEVIEEINDDLRQYREDVTNNRFNTLRVLAKTYGHEASSKLTSLLDHYENVFKEKLSGIPESTQKVYNSFYESFRIFRPYPPIPELDLDDIGFEAS